MSSIFNTPPNTTDPMELLRYFQELRDSRIDTFRKSTSQFPSVFNRPERLAEDTNEKGNNYLASIFDSLSVQTAEAVEQVGPTIARIKEEQKQEQILNKLNLEDTSFDAERMININKTPVRKEVEAIDGSVTDSTNAPGTNTITTDGNSAGKVEEGLVSRPYDAERIIENNKLLGKGSEYNFMLPSSKFRKALKEKEAGSYSTLFGNSEIRSTPFKDIDVTKMKMSEVLDFVKLNGAFHKYNKKTFNKNTTAIGKYQFIGATLRDLKKRGVFKELEISDNTLFSQETQDKLSAYQAVHRLKDRAGVTYASAREEMRNEWEGFKGIKNTQLDSIIEEIGDEIGVSFSYSNSRSGDSLMAKTTPIKKSTNAIKVKKGQTLGGIAKANNTTVAILKKANNIKDENKINVGQSISIPKA